MNVSEVLEQSGAMISLIGGYRQDERTRELGTGRAKKKKKKHIPGYDRIVSAHVNQSISQTVEIIAKLLVMSHLSNQSS